MIKKVEELKKILKQKIDYYSGQDSIALSKMTVKEIVKVLDKVRRKIK